MEPTAEAWSKTLLELLENPDEAHRLGTAARERIDREFAHGVVVDRYLELYRRMIAGDGPEPLAAKFRLATAQFTLPEPEALDPSQTRSPPRPSARLGLR